MLMSTSYANGTEKGSAAATAAVEVDGDGWGEGMIAVTGWSSSFALCQARPAEHGGV